MHLITICSLHCDFTCALWTLQDKWLEPTFVELASYSRRDDATVEGLLTKVTTVTGEPYPCDGVWRNDKGTPVVIWTDFLAARQLCSAKASCT